MKTLFPIYKKENYITLSGYMDENGNTIVPPTYHGCTYMNEGFAFLNKRVGNNYEEQNYIVNATGEIIHEFEKISPMGGFQEGKGYGHREDGTMNFVLFNTKGEIIHEFPKGISVHKHFKEEKMVLAKKNDLDGGYLFAFFSLEKGIMTEFIYEDYISSFYEGIAFVYNHQKKEKGIYFIDHDFNELKTVPCHKRHDASFFYNNIAPVRSKEKKMNHDLVHFYINKNGEIAFDADFKTANPCIDGHAIVELHSGEYAGIDYNGKIMFTTSEYYIHGTFQNGLAQCRKGNKAGLIDINGNLLFPMKYDHVSHFNNHPLAVAVLDREKFYINKEGEIVAPLHQ